MQEDMSARLRDWVEPAHPGVIKFHDDLINIYTAIRDKYQDHIDQAFDRVSRQIGFVVTTTMPVTMDFSDKGLTTSVGAPNLKGTIFEKEILGELAPLGDQLRGKIEPGTYNLYLIWYSALKLKLRTDWMEPAHLARPGLTTPASTIGEAISRAARPGIGPGVREPAHWFDPGTAINLQEALVIAAIDQVYPDLRLVDRIDTARAQAGRFIGPGVREPAHFRGLLQNIDPQTLDQVVQVVQVIRAFQQLR